MDNSQQRLTPMQMREMLEWLTAWSKTAALRQVTAFEATGSFHPTDISIMRSRCGA